MRELFNFATDLCARSPSCEVLFLAGKQCPLGPEHAPLQTCVLKFCIYAAPEVQRCSASLLQLAPCIPKQSRNETSGQNGHILDKVRGFLSRMTDLRLTVVYCQHKYIRRRRPDDEGHIYRLTDFRAFEWRAYEYLWRGAQRVQCRRQWWRSRDVSYPEDVFR